MILLTYDCSLPSRVSVLSVHTSASSALLSRYDSFGLSPFSIILLCHQSSALTCPELTLPIPSIFHLPSPFSRIRPTSPASTSLPPLHQPANTPQFPWYKVEHITLAARNNLFDATVCLTNELVKRIHKAERPDEYRQMGEPKVEPHVSISRGLVKRVHRAVMRCPGFTEAQKFIIDEICSVFDTYDPETRLAPFADMWIFETLGPKPGIAQDVLLVSLHHSFLAFLVNFACSILVTSTFVDKRRRNGPHGSSP